MADPVAEELVAGLRRDLGVTPAFARMLVRRGLGAAADAESFLAARLDGLHDPLTLPDMPAAVARLRTAVREKQRVVLFGDYDADGVSATALLTRFLRVLQVSVHPVVPERERGGYGLNVEALAQIRSLRPQLVVTLDNGTSAHEPIAALRAEGVDSIVVDHHHVPAGELPPALAVVNPKRADSRYPFAELCAAGLAFKLAWALAMDFSRSKKVAPEFRAFLLDALALAAVGTLADVVPLVDENRILAAQGLKALARPSAPGLRALLGKCSLRGAAPTASDVAFRLAPRLNAAGRCGEAAEALELLLTEDAARAAELACRLDDLNRERQGLEQEILKEARARALAAMAVPGAAPAFVLESADWHPGVIGIVAARLAEEFHRPAILLVLDPQRGLARGSGRSIPGFHLAAALTESAAHLISYGGHAAAAGLTAHCAAVPAFRAAFEATAARSIPAAALNPALHIEDAVDLCAVDGTFCQELARLEPCGAGNPAPLLAAFGVCVASPVRPLDKQEKHVGFYARQDGAVRRAVGFGMGPHYNTLCGLAAGPVDLAFRPSLNTFRGETQVELHLQAFRASRVEPARALAAGAAGD